MKNNSTSNNDQYTALQHIRIGAKSIKSRSPVLKVGELETMMVIIMSPTIPDKKQEDHALSLRSINNRPWRPTDVLSTPGPLEKGSPRRKKPPEAIGRTRRLLEDRTSCVVVCWGIIRLTRRHLTRGGSGMIGVAFGGTGIALPDGYSFQRRDLHTYHPEPAKTVVPAPPPLGMARDCPSPDFSFGIGQFSFLKQSHRCERTATASRLSIFSSREKL